jgi:hypothetical protein
MTSDPTNNYGGPAVPSVGVDPKNRRKSPRYPMSAEARVTNLKTETEFGARISELSVSGCFLDTLNPLPDGSELHVKVSKESGVFETDANVVYSRPRLGLGIRFVNTDEVQQAILGSWIEEAFSNKLKELRPAPGSSNYSKAH